MTENSKALSLFQVAFKAVEIVERFKPLSIEGKFEALLLNALMALITFQNRYGSSSEYAEVEENFMGLVVMVAKEHNIAHKVNDLADLINDRMGFYDDEINKLISSPTYFPGRIYDAFYINPLANDPQVFSDLSQIMMFQPLLRKMISDVQDKAGRI